MLLKILAIFLSFVGANDKLFLEHVSRYGLTYRTRAEYEFRLAQFMKTDRQIKEINSK
jgi:C1A family cysteine protease